MVLGRPGPAEGGGLQQDLLLLPEFKVQKSQGVAERKLEGSQGPCTAQGSDFVLHALLHSQPRAQLPRPCFIFPFWREGLLFSTHFYPPLLWI